MGWTRYLLLGDLGQQLDLDDQEARLSRLAIRKSSRDREQDERIAELERDVLQLNAGLAALVGLLRDKRIATDGEIARALELATREAEKALATKQLNAAAAAATATKQAAARKLDRVRRRR